MTTDVDGAVFAITTPAGKFDFYLRQDGSSADIYISTGLESSRRTALGWQVPGVFFSNIRRSIIFSYDGAQGFLYVDGRKMSQSFYMSPGVGMVGALVRIKTDELVAYSVLYKSLVFLPVGFLLGLAVRKMPQHGAFYKLAIAAGIVVPSVLLEVLLVEVSGRRPSILQVSTSIGLTVAGMIWMNLDSPESRPKPCMIDSKVPDQCL